MEASCSIGRDEYYKYVTKTLSSMQLLSGKALRYIVVSLAVLSIFAACFIWYFCSGETCTLGSNRSGRFSLSDWNMKVKGWYDTDIKKKQSFLFKETVNNLKEDKLLVERFDFNIRGSDVIVFLHIQNTGGSVFARHIIDDLALERACSCKRNRRICHCYRPNKRGSTWLFSRYTMGWKCGVHPDWSELTSCVDRVMDEEEGIPLKRRYFFITLLRDPVKRFLSEFWHVRKGQSWRSFRHWCSGVEATSEELPSCFSNEDLKDLTLQEYVSCPYNLAINRQTRMLSDLQLVGCYNSSAMAKEERDLVMLASAKNNLHKMAFFGLSEFPKVSQYMFEATFDLSFLEKDPQFHGLTSSSRSGRKALFEELSPKEIETVKEINKLDMDLYYYAKNLLFSRFEKLKHIDPEFEDNFETVRKNKVSNENWAEKEDSFDGSSQ